ncbi:hypothetical protein [Qingshengfaniella alkalisoli]|uniref:Uncharacterized protein n=1 Tax=Qingshengfaniella alkalisoli TaxID=2599296 RepID=A0A5B8IZ09_9RHOB|nr:hypothetical protein [Qingshengfaniella alkalisoli]QDY71362.1 hypothetical protein FPZ52_16815 [Qingshengfaniella alkalisoli]
MATKGEMVRALAAQFDLNPNKVDAMTRAMARKGLRSPGGRGRAATHMSGEDIFHLTLALVMNLETKDATDIVSELSQLPLVCGDLIRDGHIQWETTQDASELLDALQRLPVAGLEMARSFGAFCGHWLEQGFNAPSEGFASCSVSVEISSNGPHAVFSHQSEDGDLKVWFGTPPGELSEPEWERRISLSDKLFRRLAVLAEGSRS